MQNTGRCGGPSRRMVEALFCRAKWKAAQRWSEDGDDGKHETAVCMTWRSQMHVRDLWSEVATELVALSISVEVAETKGTDGQSSLLGSIPIRMNALNICCLGGGDIKR